jgi:hypothetical protein
MKSLVITGAILIAATISFVQPVAAGSPGEWTGNRVAADCQVSAGKRSVEGAMRATTCYGYVRGVGDGFIAAGACLPSAITTQQLVDVAVKFMRENPQHRHEYAAHIFQASWAAAWPCQGDNGGNTNSGPKFKSSS